MSEGAGAWSGDTLGAARCQLWGVLNVTPDSFSDGGEHLDAAEAVAFGCRLVAAGADVVDVGGESTRPAGGTYGTGAAPVSVEEEMARVIPVVVGLVREGVAVSVDTRRGAVAEAALDAGAGYINDVSAQAEPALLDRVARAGATLVRMHNRGRGEVAAPNTVYKDLVAEVTEELRQEAERALAAGISPDRLWIDPGLGFAKTPEQSMCLLANTSALTELGFPLLVGASRKSFLAHASPGVDGSLPPPKERLGGSTAALVWAVLASAHAVRVHDVASARQALLVTERLFGLASQPREVSP